MLNANVICSY